VAGDEIVVVADQQPGVLRVLRVQRGQDVHRLSGDIVI